MRPWEGSRSRGSALIAVFIFTLVLLAMSAGFLVMTTGEFRLNRKSYYNAAAINLAEAGAEYILWRMNLPPGNELRIVSDTTIPLSTLQAADGRSVGEYEGKVSGMGGSNVYITSTGYVPSKSAAAKNARSVKIKVHPGAPGGPFDMAFFGNNSVTLTGSCLADSYDSSLGPYGVNNNDKNCDIGTNGTGISITGSTQLKGDIKAFGSNAGAVSITGSGSIEGDISTRGTNGSITITGSRTITGNISTTGTTSSTISITGSETINGSLSVSGTSAGAISITGTAHVSGDAATGPGGTVTQTPQGLVAGNITHSQGVEAPEPAKELPAVAVPSSLTSLGYGANGLHLDGLWTKTGSGAADPIPGGNWKLKRIKLTGSTSLTIGTAGMETNIYLTGDTGDSILQTGSTTITCLGKVTFYVDAKVQSTGSGLWNATNTPPNLLIYGTSTCSDVKLTGSTAFYGAVYAPSADVHVTGSNASYGSFIGKTIDATGNVGFHYDEALREVAGGEASGYTVVYWQEKQ